MRNRNTRVRILTGGMAAIMMMSTFTPLVANAAELPDEEPVAVEQTIEYAPAEVVAEEVTVTVEETSTEEAPVEEISVEETSEEVIPEEIQEAAEENVSLVAEETATEEKTVEEPTYKADVVDTVVKDIQITQSKSKKIVVEYLKSGERVITTQYFENGVMVNETVFNSQEIVDEISEQQVAEIEEIQRQLEEERQRKAAEEEEKRQIALKEEEERRRQEEAEKKEIEEVLSQFNYSSIEEFLDAYFDYITNVEPGDKTYQIVGSTYTSNKANPDVVLKYVKKACNNGLDGLLKLVPGSDFYRDTVKSLIGDVLDLNEGGAQQDLTDLINKNHADLEQKITQGIKETKENTIAITALTTYGNRLDKFADDATTRAIAIDKYRGDAELSDAARNVKIAHLIGHSDDWDTGKGDADIMKDLFTAAQVFKGNTNVESRDIYTLIYDLHKGDALFAGEAMAQSESTIRTKVNSFLRNCGVVIECLKAHQAVSKLTEEEVNSLDAHTREMYNQIKSDTKDIKSELRTVAAILLGDKNNKYDQLKTGIFTKAEEYYSKNKTTYIDHGTRNLNLKSELNYTLGKNLMKEDKIHVDMIELIKRLKTNGLSPEDYEKINNQARSLGMSITEYLQYSGFDTTALGTGYTYLASDIYTHVPEEWLWSCDGYVKAGMTTYTMNTKYTEKSDVVLYEHHKVKIYGIEDTISKNLDHTYNQGVGFVFLELDNQ